MIVMLLALAGVSISVGAVGIGLAAWARKAGR
jgi:hypothetical protein